MRSHVFALPVFVLGCALAGPVAAQETAPPPPDTKAAPERVEAKAAPERPEPRPVPKLVRVQLLLVRQQGEKKTASIPYTLVASTDGDWGHLRMGVEVPIAVGAADSKSFRTKNVGTDIDFKARTAAGDRYAVELHVENSSFYGRTGDAGTTRDAAVASDGPMFRSFKASFSLVLRDGQSLQTVASTDPITGEVTTIDVTLHVVK
jgi:hypothetical protein